MKKIISLVLFVMLVITAFTQSDSLVHFTINSKKVSDSTYQLNGVATIKSGWHLYSNATGVDGLIGISLSFDDDYIVATKPLVFNQTPSIIEDALFAKSVEVFTKEVGFTQSIKIKGKAPAILKVFINANLGSDAELHQAEDTVVLNVNGGVITHSNSVIKINSININQPLNECGSTTPVSKGYMSIFLLGFLGGFIALFTPCVFPMIPVTVSFFTRRSPNKKKAIKNGSLYALFIFIIYLLASIPFHILGNVQPEIFNNISTNAWLNIAFFIIFIIFSISFFGFFEITIPSNIANKADTKSGLGSVSGIFFMALTLAIVSFSCTGPILGSLLVGSLSGGAWQLTAGLAGFGIALALPFGLFAVFPNWLQSLPKSGGWLDTVKKVLAFAEVALAFKFLSNADLVMHWGILKREIFFASWIIIGTGLTLYLFGILRLPHDVKGMKISKGRKVVGVLALLFTLYLIPGITSSKYANLQLLSGFPPPLSYSIYGEDNLKGKGLEANVLNDYEKALQLSKNLHKPLLIDFTGWACVNCRKMEENVWTETDVKKYITDNYILVSLYVDDKRKLPAAEQIINYTTKEGNQKDIINIGDKWATFQAENFNQVTQPLYVVINNKEQLVNRPIGYTPNAKAYLQWLQCGKQAFDAQY
jgi:thiol:disulfide interchange protein DsbD